MHQATLKETLHTAARERSFLGAVQVGRNFLGLLFLNNRTIKSLLSCTVSSIYIVTAIYRFNIFQVGFLDSRTSGLVGRSALSERPGHCTDSFDSQGNTDLQVF